MEISSNQLSVEDDLPSTAVNFSPSQRKLQSQNNIQVVAVDVDDEETLDTVERVEAFKKELQANLKAKEREHEELQKCGQLKKAEALCNKIFDMYNEIRAVNAFLIKKQRKSQGLSSQYPLLVIKGTGLASLDQMLTEYMRSLSNGYYGLPSPDDVHNMIAKLRHTSDPNVEEVLKSGGGEKKPLEPPRTLPPVYESESLSVKAIKKAVQTIVAKDQSYLAEEDINDTEDVTLFEEGDDEENEVSFMEIDDDEEEDEVDRDKLVEVHNATVKSADSNLVEPSRVVDETSSEANKSIVEDLFDTIAIGGTHVTVRRQNSLFEETGDQTADQDSTISDLEEYTDDECDVSSLMAAANKRVGRFCQEFRPKKAGIKVYGLPRKAGIQQEIIDIIDLRHSSQEHAGSHCSCEVSDDSDDEIEITFSTIE